jgi:Ca-activated chloride channel family protein
MDLEAIYRDQIRAQMDTTTVESHRKRLWADRYQWPLALAVLLMIGSRWIPLKTAGTTALLLVAAVLLTAPPTWAGPRQEGYKAYQADKFDEALDHFTQAQVQDPNDPAVLYNLGNTMYKRQDYDGAATHYRQALPHASESLKPRLLYNLGNTAYRQGELQTAIESYESALKLAPDDRQAKENLAFVKRRLEQQQQQGQQSPQQDKSQQDANNPQPQNPTGGRDAHQQGQSQPQQRDGRKQQTEQPPSGEKSDMQDRTPQNPADQQAQATEPKSVNPKDRAQQPGRPPEAQMLNRLKDEPGRAMMPQYQKKTVDKDW